MMMCVREGGGGRREEVEEEGRQAAESRHKLTKSRLSQVSGHR